MLLYKTLHIFVAKVQLSGSLNPIGLQSPELASGHILLYGIAHEFNLGLALSFGNAPRLFEKRCRKAD